MRHALIRWGESSDLPRTTLEPSAERTGTGTGGLLGPGGTSGREGSKRCARSSLSTARRARGPEHRSACLSLMLQL